MPVVPSWLLTPGGAGGTRRGSLAPFRRPPWEASEAGAGDRNEQRPVSAKPPEPRAMKQTHCRRKAGPLSDSAREELRKGNSRVPESHAFYSVCYKIHLSGSGANGYGNQGLRPLVWGMPAHSPRGVGARGLCLLQELQDPGGRARPSARGLSLETLRPWPHDSFRHDSSALFLMSRVPCAAFGDLSFQGGGGWQHEGFPAKRKQHHSFTGETGVQMITVRPKSGSHSGPAGCRPHS